MGSLGSIVGGIAGSFVPGVGTALGSAIGGSLGGGKDATKQANAINASMPNTFQFLPQQLQQDVLDYAATYRQQAKLPYEQYSGERIAEFTPEEQQAFDLIRGNVGQYSDAGNEALGNLEQLTSQYLGAPTQETLQGYMNPYQQSVIDIAKREAVRDYEGSTVPGITSKAAQAGAFGGSRQAILESEASRNLNQQLGDIQSKGLQEAYDKAMANYYKTGSLGSTMLARTGALAQQGLDVAGKEAAALQSVGTNIRDMDQSQLDLAYQDYLDKRNYPIQQAELLRQGFQNTGQYFSPLGTPVNPAEAKYAANASGQQGLMSALGSLGGLGSLFGGSSSGGGSNITWEQTGPSAGLGANIFNLGFAEGGPVKFLKGGSVLEGIEEWLADSPSKSRLRAVENVRKRNKEKQDLQRIKTAKADAIRPTDALMAQKEVANTINRAVSNVTPNSSMTYPEVLPVDVNKPYSQTVGFNPEVGGPVSRVMTQQPQQQTSTGSSTLDKIMQKIEQIQPYSFQNVKPTAEAVGAYSPEAMAVLSPNAYKATQDRANRDIQRAQLDQQERQFAYKTQTTPLDALIQAGQLENSQAYADIQRMFASQKGEGTSAGSASLQKFMIKRQDDEAKAAKKAYTDLLNGSMAGDKAGARQQVMEIYGIDPLSGASESLPGATNVVPYTQVITN